MSSALATARDLLESGVSAGTCSAAQAAWARDGEPIECVAVGTTRAVGGEPIAPETLFDIASLTKPFTASAVLRLIARGDLLLSARVRELVPELANASTGGATLEQLLAHEAGFQDWAPLFEQIDPDARGTPEGANQLISLALQVPARAGPGDAAVYSDLGFIALGRAIELATGDGLDSIIAREVTEPLGLPGVHYRSTLRSSRSERGRVAATEHCPWRGRVLQGEVHDDNAWTMGGVAAHAGLFGTAADVARFGAAWLEALAGSDWLPADLARRASDRRPLGRGLGWDLKSEEGSLAGSRMGPRTFGHLGFTGCSLWVDPDAELSVALSTNRVHPTRDNEAIRELRPAFHDALVAALG
jgi:CubicO group peptidase (beta-lactamase class C family)